MCTSSISIHKANTTYCQEFLAVHWQTCRGRKTDFSSIIETRKLERNLFGTDGIHFTLNLLDSRADTVPSTVVTHTDCTRKLALVGSVGDICGHYANLNLGARLAHISEIIIKMKHT